MSGRLDGLPIQKLLKIIDTLESRILRTGNVTYERGGNSLGSTAHMEERVIELDNSQKTMLEMISGMSEDFRTLDVVRNELAEMNTKVNHTMRAMANQALTEEQAKLA